MMSKSKKKQKPLPPRRQRMNRAGRLQSAKKWLESFEGKNIVRGYAKWFGVELLCAAEELQLLEVEVDAAYLERLRVTVQNRRRKKSKAIDDGVSDLGGCDERFSFILGHTSNGMPFGIPWGRRRHPALIGHRPPAAQLLDVVRWTLTAHKVSSIST